MKLLVWLVFVSCVSYCLGDKMVVDVFCGLIYCLGVGVVFVGLEVICLGDLVLFCCVNDMVDIVYVLVRNNKCMVEIVCLIK